MKTVIAKQGQMVDAICREEYGDESGYAEAVLATNPGLAELGPKLPFGTVVKLPEIEPVQSKPQIVTLWS